MVFVSEITNIWHKSQDFFFADFFSCYFKNPHAGMVFPMDFWLFSMCFINFLFEDITNLKFDKRCFIKENISKN